MGDSLHEGRCNRLLSGNKQKPFLFLTVVCHDSAGVSP